jgi:xylulokinase
VFLQPPLAVPFIHDKKDCLMLLIGLDIGTTGCKASIFDLYGKRLCSASREYSIEFPYPTWAEQDAEQVWLLAQQALAEAYRQLIGRPQVSAIGLSVQGEAIIPVDRAGAALRPAILGMDTRTDAENAWLRQQFGPDYLYQHTGMPVHTINTLPKLVWLKKNEPDIWMRADQFLLYEDFFIRKMTGRAAISRCLASRTQLYDLHQDRWSVEIMGALELNPARLAEVLPSGTAVGKLHEDLASALGFPNNPLVVTGGHDQACGALGVGLTRPGLSMVSTGTAEVVEVALGSLALTPELAAGNISVYAHTVPGLYVTMTLNHSGGLILRWFRDTFCQDDIARAAISGSDAYDLIYRNASSEPSSLLLLPHFSGSGTPHFDTQSKGALLGFTFGTTRSEVAKAILEGLTFELRYNLEVMKSGGVQIDELRAIGGGARSNVWLKLKADITGIPVAVPRITEAASWGAAALAGAGAGVFSSAAEAVENTLQFDRVIEPDPHVQARYDARYALYCQIYPALRDLLHKL